MSARRKRRLTRGAAERVLRGGPVDRGDAERLAALLAAAGAPPRDGELDGRHAAMEAFRSARVGPVPQHRRRPMLTKLLAAKLAAGVTTVTASAGIAVAAGTGHLPQPFTGGGHHAAAHATATRDHTRGTEPSGRNTAHPTPGSTDGHGPNGTPSPSMVGLCHAFEAGAGDNPGKALDNPAFSVLITTAGGRDKVDGFCQNVLGDAKSHGSPTAHPTGASGEHGRPSDHPTGASGGTHSHEPDPHPSDGHGAPTH